MRNRIVAGMLAAGLTAAWVVAAGGSAAGAAAAPTCTVTAIRLSDSRANGEAGTDLTTAGGFDGCFGAYRFYGVTPTQLGYANVTTDNYAELATALEHWNSIDGVPAVSEWVNLSPAVASGMQAAGINPTMFLQWVNEYDGAGTVSHPAMPPTWPSFLPKALVSDPATIAGGTADQTISSPKPTPPPQAAPQPTVTPVQPPVAQKPTQPASSTVATAPTSSGVSYAAQTPATSTSAPASAPPKKAPVATRPPVVVATAPPVAVATDGVTVPCVVASACRQTVVAHDTWDATPWYAKAALQVWWHRWWEVAALAFAAAATVVGRAIVIGRRNLAWYGNVRGPR